MKNTFICSVFFFSLFLGVMGFSQSLWSQKNLERMHAIDALIGFKLNSNSSVRVSETGTQSKTHFTGFIGYQYFWKNQWAICAKIGVFTAESAVQFSGMKTSSLTIVPILFGISYYPNALSFNHVGRVHLGIHGGAYMASGTKTDFSEAQFVSTSVNETVLGMEPNVGIDFLFSQWLAIGPLFSYHWISQFKQVRESPRDYSGSVWGVHMAVLL